MQANAYRTTSIMATRQRVQIQAKYSLAGRTTTVGATSNAMVSGECR